MCTQPGRQDLERKWIDWENTSRLARECGVSRDSIYRHAHAFGLFAKRQRNVRKALERTIEQADTVEVTAPAVVSAIQAYVKTNAHGQWVDRLEDVNVNEPFEPMTREELDRYARDGCLPKWFRAAVAATGVDSQEA